MFKRRSLVNKRTKILALLSMWLLWMGVGYAYLSSMLTINGSTEVEDNIWDVHFSNLQIVRGSVTPTIVPSLSGTSTNIAYSVKLSKPGDYYIFYVDVNNSGTIDAMLNDLSITNLTAEQSLYSNYSVTYSDGTAITTGDKLAKGKTVKLKVVYEFKQDLENSNLPASNQPLSLSLSMTYVQAVDGAVEKDLKPARKVTNSDIGKYIDLGKNAIGTEATTDDWRVLWVDETNNLTYLILADFLPTSKMPTATGIENNGSYNVYSTVDRDTLLNYMTSSVRWNNLIDGSIPGATVTGGPTKEVVEASYTAKYGGSWTNATAKADNLLVPHNDEWNSCRGYWLASPDAVHGGSVRRVIYRGDSDNYVFNYTYCGVRPVVCLSSDTPLKVVENAILEIPDAQMETANGQTITLTKQNASSYYGEIINYKANESDTLTWRLFYYDIEGKYGTPKTIYLKADFINSETPLVNYNNYVSNDTTILEKMNPLWATNRLNKQWNTNEYSVAWLLDSSQWSRYANQDANYAIGSPSLEMYIDSYNESFPEEKLYYKYYEENNVGGYMYSTDGSTWQYWLPGPCINVGKNRMYLTYSKKENDRGLEWWLASPNAYLDGTRVCKVGGAAVYVGHSQCTYETGTTVRGNCPVVSLKPGVVPKLK